VRLARVASGKCTLVGVKKVLVLPWKRFAIPGGPPALGCILSIFPGKGVGRQLTALQVKVLAASFVGALLRREARRGGTRRLHSSLRIALSGDKVTGAGGGRPSPAR